VTSYYLKTKANSVIEFRCESNGNRWSIWYDQDGKGEVNEKMHVDVWIVNAAEKGIVTRPDGYYETQAARLIWNHLVRHNHMVRTTLKEMV